MPFPDADLARRLERERGHGNLTYVKSFRQLYPHADTDVEAVADGHAIFVGKDSPISRAVDLGIDSPISAADLDRVEAFYFDRGMACRVDITPFSDRSLVELLGARGYRVAWFLNLLIRPVSAEDSAIPPSPGVVVEPVDASSIPLWASVVDRGFGGTGAIDQPNIAHATGHRVSMRCFLARVDGEPAGGGSVAIGNGVAGFLSTSVLPQYRNRGVQTALLRVRLSAAFAAGCQIAEVQTSPGSNSQRNVMRAGFQVAYTRMVMVREKA